MYGAVKENLIFLSFSSIKLSGNISQQNFFCKFFCVGSACGIDCDQLLYNLQYSTVQYSTVQYSTANRANITTHLLYKVLTLMLKIHLKGQS